MHLAILNSVLIIEIKDYNESSSIALHIARSGKYRSKKYFVTVLSTVFKYQYFTYLLYFYFSRNIVTQISVLSTPFKTGL